ncbi:MAG: alanyl-tRNA editing protein [Chloroflexi bacterium]|nr:alanyl-tRNA editing protein [Chloroflexota bacterium]
MAPATRRLYHEDPYCTRFEARVLRTDCIGDQPAVLLDATCFYPTSGGQPHDTGRLNDVPVVDVLEQGDEVLHILAAPLAAERVSGEVDVARRLDHMQQHTGQHILSQAFVRTLGAATVSFHLGDSASTIDVELAGLDDAAATRAEEEANATVLANQPVVTHIYGAGEAVTEALRKQPTVSGELRVVTVGAYDASACCGTHLRATGEVGCIHIRRWERSKGQTRVEFLCGWRALRHLREQNRMVQALAVQYSIAPAELPQTMQRLADEADAGHKQVLDLRKRLLAAELPAMAAQAEPVGAWRVLVRQLDGYDVAALRTAAQAFTQEPDRIALLAVADPAPQLCFARSANVAADMGRLLREALAPSGGRGGGSRQLAQGGGVTAADLARVLAAARTLLDAMERR